MRRFFVRVSLALAVTTNASFDLTAQPVALPGDGDWAIALELVGPSSDLTFGSYRMFGERLRLGIETQYSLASGSAEITQNSPPFPSEASTWAFNLGPTLRYYGSRMGPVSPFLRAKIGFGWAASESKLGDEATEESRSSSIGASLGLGAEWFPLRWLGVSGHTGLAFDRTHDQEVRFATNTRIERTIWNVRTFRSGIFVNLYFR